VYSELSAPLQQPLPVVVGGPVRRHAVFQRRIYYVRADDQGHVNNLAWSMLWFDGLSVFRLRGDLANELGEENPDSITLCVRAGSQGRWTPLVTDLPENEQTMDIIVLATESAGENFAVFFLYSVQQLLCQLIFSEQEQFRSWEFSVNLLDFCCMSDVQSS
jgi:hypothetical protein